MLKIPIFTWAYHHAKSYIASPSRWSNAGSCGLECSVISFGRYYRNSPAKKSHILRPPCHHAFLSDQHSFKERDSTLAKSSQFTTSKIMDYGYLKL